jgi:hypothetical protein
MRTSRCLPLAALIAFALSLPGYAAESTAEPPAPPETTRFLADLRTNLPNGFANGSWQGKISVTPSGTMILGTKGADGKGEMGQTLEAPLDLSQEKFIELALGVGARNEVPEVTIAFSDATGTQYTARLRIDQVLPQQAVWFHVRLADFRLNDWQGDRAGKKIDWTRIKQWHLQGDWSTTAPFHVMFIALRARH